MLTIATVFKMFGLNSYNEGKQTITIGGQEFELYYSYDERENEDFHKLSQKGKEVYIADKSCRNPVWMEEDAQRLLNFLTSIATPTPIKKEEPEMKLLALKTLNANQTVLTIKYKDTVFTVSNFKGKLGTKMKKYFGTQTQIRNIARNRKGHFVSIKGLEDQILEMISYTAAKPVIIKEPVNQTQVKEVTTMKSNTTNLEFNSNVSNNEVKKVLTSMGINLADVNLTQLKSMNSKANATSIILSAICTTLDSNAVLDPTGFINTYIKDVKASGGYTSECLIGTLKNLWKHVATDLHSTPEMHKIIKELVIKTHAHLILNTHQTIKELQTSMNLIAISLVAPQ